MYWEQPVEDVKMSTHIFVVGCALRERVQTMAWNAFGFPVKISAKMISMALLPILDTGCRSNVRKSACKQSKEYHDKSAKKCRGDVSICSSFLRCPPHCISFSFAPTLYKRTKLDSFIYVTPCFFDFEACPRPLFSSLPFQIPVTMGTIPD